MKKLITLLCFIQFTNGIDDLNSLINEKLNTPEIDKNTTKRTDSNTTNNQKLMSTKGTPTELKRIGIEILGGVLNNIIDK